MKQVFEKGVDPMPGMFEVLDRFKPRYSLAIATKQRNPMYLVDIILRVLDMRPVFHRDSNV